MAKRKPKPEQAPPVLRWVATVRIPGLDDQQRTIGPISAIDEDGVRVQLQAINAEVLDIRSAEES